MENPHGIAMPQIWMTYAELAAMLDCTMEQARERVHLDGLDRKLSRDGKKRAKLSTELIGLFIERLRSIDGAVANLRQVHALLSDYDPPGEPALPAWLRSGRAG
jgi:hypothetical protein